MGQSNERVKEETWLRSHPGASESYETRQEDCGKAMVGEATLLLFMWNSIYPLK